MNNGRCILILWSCGTSFRAEQRWAKASTAHKGGTYRAAELYVQTHPVRCEDQFQNASSFIALSVCGLRYIKAETVNKNTDHKILLNIVLMTDILYLVSLCHRA